MEAKAFLKSLLLTSVMLIGAAGCTTTAKHPGGTSTYPQPQPSASVVPEQASPKEVYGPELPTSPYGPEPIQHRPVVLVFGPGLAHGFSYAGVIRELDRLHVPIAGIVGTEMGALIGALFAVSGNINEFEWGMLKLKDQPFVHNSSLISKLFHRVPENRGLNDVLTQVFLNKDIRETKIPLRILIHQKQPEANPVLDSGPLAQAVRASLAVPGVISAVEFEHKQAESSGNSRPFPIAEARMLVPGAAVIVVDDLVEKVSDQNKADSLEIQVAKSMAEVRRRNRTELGQADLILRPEMKGIGYLDFQKRTEAAFRGKKAVQAQIELIRRLVSLPGGDDAGASQP